MQPFFLEGQSGSLFAVCWEPSFGTPKNALLHVPAFADEMNRSRHMVAVQAKALADQGVAVLVLDLFGTGESQGDFVEATWDVWLADIAAGVAWLKSIGISRIGLWSIRAGSLLALDFMRLNPGEVNRLLLWQPVLNGDLFVTQFLRLRVAAAMMNSSASPEKTGDLKKQLQQGQTIEVAGYGLNPGLMMPLMAQKNPEPSPMTCLQSIDIFEILSENVEQFTLGNQQFVDKCNEFGTFASLTGVVGAQFWASQEITTAQALLPAMYEKIALWQ